MVQPDEEEIIDVPRALHYAAEVKRRAISAQRREYEEAPRFVQHTVVTDIDAEYVAVRSSSLENRCAFAKNYIEKGNQAAASMLFDEALECYTDALAAFCYFEREDGLSSSKMKYNDYLNEPTSSEEGRNIVKQIMLNASACLMNSDLTSNALEIDWACSQALRVDECCAKAYYRRGRARSRLHDEASDERSLSDLRSAAGLAPEEEEYARALSAALRSTTKTKDARREMFSKMFSGAEGIYKGAECEKTEMVGAEHSARDAVVDEMLASAHLREKATSMGFDVEDAQFREQFAALVDDELRASRTKRAEVLGIDLEDDQVKRAVDFFEAKRRKASVSESSRELTSNVSLTSLLPSVFVVFVCIRVAFVAYKLITRPLPPLEEFYNA
jgi:magnesium-dependent phosphatase 1